MKNTLQIYGLFVTLTDDIGLLSGIDSIGVAIVAIVELLHSAS